MRLCNKFGKSLVLRNLATLQSIENTFIRGKVPTKIGVLRMQAPNGDRDKNAEAQERRIKVHAILSGERLAHFEKYLIETSGVRTLTDEQIADAARRMLYEWIDHLVIEP